MSNALCGSRCSINLTDTEIMQITVFSKNHPGHLVAAASIGAADSDQRVMFRSSRRWAEAKRVVEARGPIPILFAVNGTNPEVRYRALLQEVRLNPDPADARCTELLELRPPTTRNEPFWDTNPKTFYVISSCCEIPPIPYRRLLKAKNREPLSDDFGYSYALVLAPDADQGPAAASVDTASPPARVLATTERIVRDTALTRRLKALHADTCQLCGTRLTLADGAGYSEAHHLKPLGRPHSGPDVEGNVLVLCPNCHALCDYRAMPLTADRIRTVLGHRIGAEYVDYHNSLIRQTTRRRTAVAT
jgi:hypothetical protein